MSGSHRSSEQRTPLQLFCASSGNAEAQSAMVHESAQYAASHPRALHPMNAVFGSTHRNGDKAASHPPRPHSANVHDRVAVDPKTGGPEDFARPRNAKAMSTCGIRENSHVHVQIAHHLCLSRDP